MSHTEDLEELAEYAPSLVGFRKADPADPHHQRALRRVEADMVAPRGLRRAELQAEERHALAISHLLKVAHALEDLVPFPVGDLQAALQYLRELPPRYCPCDSVLADPGPYHLPACPLYDCDAGDCPF